MTPGEARTPSSPARPTVLRPGGNGFLLHLRPVEVPERTLRLSGSWGLGGIATVLLSVLFVSGLLLKFLFEPTPEQAYDSIVFLQTQVSFGQLMRNLHRWSGNAVMFVLFLHMLRVFYTGAIDAPRRVNWLIGMALFAMVVLSNFTGYLLPWDQVAYWAVTVSTSMLDYLPLAGPPIKQWILGAAEPGPVTLLNFYTLHTAILPILLLSALPVHFWRIRKARGLVIPRSPGESLDDPGRMAPVIPHLLAREAAVALITLALLLLYSMWMNAPLAEPANAGLSPNPTKAPWYFMGFQELLLHFHPVFSVFVIPGLLAALCLALPWLDTDNDTAGIWFRSARGRLMALVMAAISLVATTAAVVLDESARIGSAPGMMNRGIVPLVMLAALVTAVHVMLRRVLRASRSESIMAVFTLLTIAFVVLTVIGAGFRGAGMNLAWGG